MSSQYIRIIWDVVRLVLRTVIARSNMSCMKFVMYFIASCRSVPTIHEYRTDSGGGKHGVRPLFYAISIKINIANKRFC
jgi:hypothetical protein